MSYFCAFPFEHLEITANGDAYVCCVGRLRTPVGNITTSGIRDLWNSPIACDIRASILTNEFTYCQGCRFYKDKFFHVKTAQDLNHREQAYVRGVKPSLPRRVVLSMDRSCQLSCPSCRYEQEGLVNTSVPDNLQQRVLDDPDISGVEFLWTSGSGDPLYSSVHRKMLVQIAAAKFGSCKIGLHTNGLLFKTVWGDLPEASRSRINRVSVSVDGASKKTHEMNRRGSHWEALMANLAFIRDLRIEGRLEKFKLLFVAQKNNWHEMSDFVRLAKSVHANRVVITALGNWRTFTTLEYNDRAVQRPEHPQHAAFVQALRDPILRDPIVHQKIMEV